MIMVNTITINLCLNGKVLKYENAETTGSVIRVYNGTLNLCDCSANKSGKITGGAGPNLGGGGGVYVNGGLPKGTFNMYGGSITGNTGIGVGVYNGYEFYVTGAPVISGNIDTTNNNTKASNVENDSDTVIKVGTLTDGADIGVIAGNIGTFSIGGAEYKDKLTSDRSDYMVAVDGNNLKLVRACTVSFVANGGEGSMDDIKIAAVQDILEGVADVTGTDGNITVKLTQNIKGRIEFQNIGGEFVLDLNGKTIDGGTRNEAINAGNYFTGTLTIIGEGTLKTGVNNVIYKGSSATVKFGISSGKDYFTLKNGDEDVFASEKNTENTAIGGSIQNGPLVLTQGVLPSYEVSFNANGGSGTMESVDVKEGQYYTLPANAFTRTGYTFEGWNTKADGTGRDYDDKASVIDVAGADGSITLYAKWNNIPAVAPEITSAPQGFEGASALTYGNIDADKKLSVATDVDMAIYDVTYQWYKNTQNSKDGATAVSGGTSKDLVIESGLNAGDYYYYCKITVTRKDNDETATIDTDLVKVSVNKATPSVTAPANLTATYGDTLTDVDLPDGWTWKDAETTSVGNAGVNNFTAVFTPDDTANYEEVEIDVAVARLSEPALNRLNSVFSLLSGSKYGSIPSPFRLEKFQI